MTVADLVLAAYSLLTATSLFAAGRLWGSVPGVARSRRWLATGFAVAEVILLTYYLVWTDDRLHRASYVVMNAAVVAVVAAGLGLVAAAPRERRTGFGILLPLLGALGTVSAGATMVTRTLFWPPFAFLALCLGLAPVLALAPRWKVPGYQWHRDRDLVGWGLLALCGVGAALEAVQMGNVVPGTPWFGRPSLLHFFLAGTILGLLPGRTAPLDAAEPTPNQIPWHLFNPPLSPREADLIEGLRRRLTNKELANEVGVTESTVKKHLVSLFRKAGVTSRQELFERLHLGP